MVALNSVSVFVSLFGKSPKIHLTLEQFDDQLETCLLIIEEPSPRNPYYVCEHTPTKTIVHVYIKKLTL